MATFYPQFTSDESFQEQWQRYVRTKPLINNIRDIQNANTREIKNAIQNSSEEQIRAINRTTEIVCDTLELGFDSLERNLDNVSFKIEDLRSEVSAMSSMLDWRMSILIEQQRISNLLLGNIALLLRIPDIQKERQYHIEQGLKFLKNAFFDEDFYEDSLSNLLKAESIEPSDFFVLHRIGIIYMYSSKHCDLKKAEEYFRKAAKYAAVETVNGAAITTNYLSNDDNEKEQKSTSQIESIKSKMNQMRLRSDIKIQAAESYLLASRCCYIKGEFIESNVLADKSYSIDKDFIEGGFMLAKTLVAIGENSKAADVLKDVINKDKFYSIKVATDVDLCTKAEIIKLLESLRNDALTNAKKLLKECKDITKDYFQVNNIKHEIFQIEKLIKTESYIQCKEAIDLLEKDSERVFTSDFQLKQEIFYIGDDYNVFRNKLLELITIVNNYGFVIYEEKEKIYIKHLKKTFEYLSENTPWLFPINLLNNLHGIISHSFMSKTTTLPLYVFLRKEYRYYRNISDVIIKIEEVKQAILFEEKQINDREIKREEYIQKKKLENDKENYNLAIKKSIEGFIFGVIVGAVIGVICFVIYMFVGMVFLNQSSDLAMKISKSILFCSILYFGYRHANINFNNFREK
jgi:hypothetical protein